MEKAGVTVENHRPPASHGQTLSDNVVSSTPRHERIRTYNDSGDSQIMHYITMSLKLDEETTYH